MAAPDLSMKLLIDTNDRRVLFAEAGKDVIDFLFSIISFPLATATQIITPNRMVGSIGNLFKSIEEMKGPYMLPDKNKDLLLNPSIQNPNHNTRLLLPSIEHPPPAVDTLYRCNTNDTTNAYYNSGRDPSGGTIKHCRQYVTRDPTNICPNCKARMTTEASYIESVKKESSSVEGGFVKGVVTYMIMDDLEVKPMSTISSIALLNKFNVKEFGALEEKDIILTMAEGTKLLSASLQSKTVLTDVFMKRY